MTSELPKYRRVYAALRHDILIGKYESEAKFPSEGMLMRRFGVSRITVRQAMADLKKDGFLEARSGSGTYLSALARHATGMIGLVIPDYSSSPFFKRLGDELVRAGKASGYTMLLGELPGKTPADRAHEAISLAKEYARRKVAGVIQYGQRDRRRLARTDVNCHGQQQRCNNHHIDKISYLFCNTL